MYVSSYKQIYIQTNLNTFIYLKHKPLCVFPELHVYLLPRQIFLETPMQQTICFKFAPFQYICKAGEAAISDCTASLQ